MNTDNTAAEPATAEEVFADIQQHLTRLRSAVSHLQLSEKAATKAIEAAEEVLAQQNSLSLQLREYVAQLPHPTESTQAAEQLQKLTEAAAQQSLQLEELHQFLRNETPSPLPTHLVGHEELLALVTALNERQQGMAKTVEMVGQVVEKGVTHYPSQQLAAFLQHTMEPFVPVVEMQPTLVRNQQLLQEIHLLLKGINASTAPDAQAITKSVQGVTSSLKPELGQLAKQSFEVQKMLEAINAQFSKPSLSEQKVDSLDQMVRALTRSTVAQQEAQKRQGTLTLLTLLTALATLLGLAVHFLRG